MGAFVGNNGKKEVKEIYVGVGSQLRKVKEGYIGVNGTPRLFYKAYQPQWVITQTGLWTCSTTGYYNIELHGGGGGGAASDAGSSTGGGGGGGSGEIFRNQRLTAGTNYSVTIGAGGSGGNRNGIQGTIDGQGLNGGKTTFGSFSIEGGGGGGSPTGGTKSGSLASIGSRGQTATYSGGYGYGGDGGSGGATDKSTYGNGGSGGTSYNTYNSNGSDGKPGCVILTLQKELKIPTIDIDYYYNDQAYSAWVEISTDSDGLITWEWINSHGAGQPLNNASGSGYNGMTINFSNGFRYITDGTIVVKVAETNQYAAATKELKIDHSNYYMQD